MTTTTVTTTTTTTTIIISIIIIIRTWQYKSASEQTTLVSLTIIDSCTDTETVNVTQTVSGAESLTPEITTRQISIMISMFHI